MRRLPRPSLSSLVTALVVGAAAAFVLWQLRPDLLLADTTPAGGDMGAHVWGPAYLRDHLLPAGRLTGWAPDWYAGFPWLTFYFPLPSLLVVLLDVALPYGIALKLVTVLGMVTLPVAAWAFARLADMRPPAPACLAVATLPFLFDRSFTIYGGNIPSTLAGEFAFSIALSLALVFLGVYARGLATGRHRALAAALLALTGICHVVPVFFALAGAVVLTLMRPDRRRFLRYALPVAAVAALLAAFWVVPFLARIAYTNDMGWEKIRTYRETLFPNDVLWVLGLAAVGALASIVLRRRTGIFLTVMAVVSALAFVLAPQGRLWNARLLPFWMLSLYLLAGLAVAEIGLAASRLWAEAPDRPRRGGDPDGSDDVDEDEIELIAAQQRWERRERAERAAAPITAVVALLAALVVVAVPLHSPSWLPITTDDHSFVPGWVAWNYSGYERKAAYPEYRDLVETMRRIGKDEGCGRAMWEYEPELDRMGTPMAPMLLPYWTDGCIGSMEGLFFESSATTPYHFLNQSELSSLPSRAQRDLPYRTLDVRSGVEHLRLLGVRYYMALSDEAKAQARTNPSLRLLATSGPWNVVYKDGAKDRVWEVYRVEGSDIVASLDYEPVVMTGVAKGGKEWLAAAVGWYQDSSRWDVPLAASGPDEWRRVSGAVDNPPRTPVAPATVRNVQAGDDSISFEVDRVGSPVLVKASYFPNWRVSGARGVWRVTPNQMVVIPTARKVTLRYGWTSVDVVAHLLSLLGLAGLVLLWRRGPVEYPAPTERDEEDDWPHFADEWDRALAAVGSPPPMPLPPMPPPVGDEPG